jgi:parallel beta-helix repeat protein
MIRTPQATWMRAKTLALAVLITALTVMLAAGVADAFPANLTVNSTNDSNLCIATECTLRGAITTTNANPGADTIDFNIPASDPGCNAATGVCTISPTSALPTITEAVTIDGYSQPGASANTLATGNDAALKIELSGASAGAGVDGLTITAPDSVVKGLVVNRFGDDGVVAIGLDASGNRIEGNYIGTDTAGTADLGNSNDGVNIGAGPDNIVGGTTAAARNVISGNDGDGIFVSGGNMSGNRIEGNYIGTDADGTADLGNSDNGVLLDAAANVVGGTSAGARNVISGNVDDGVFVFSGAGNRILRNSVFDNGDLGIDLVGGAENASGVTANDPGDADTGPNGLQNYPVITSATTSGGETTVQGTLNSTPDDTFNLQFFSNPTADSSGFGEGETFAGQTNVTTNAAGNVAFGFTTATPLGGGEVVAATATNTVTDDTSEFSRAIEVETGNLPPGCTIAGTPGDDILSGTSGNDSICGLGGDDRIDAGSGNDTAKGGDGIDTLYGESGSDTLRGEVGDDTVRGGAGNDDLSGGSGADKLRGEAGGDFLNARDGVKGNDLADGGSGKDTCSADKKDRKVSC